MGSEAVDAATPSEAPAKQSGLSVLHSRFGRIHLDPALGGLAQKIHQKTCKILVSRFFLRAATQMLRC